MKKNKKFFILPIKGGTPIVVIVAMMLLLVYHIDKTFTLKNIKKYIIHEYSGNIEKSEDVLSNFKDDLIHEWKKKHLYMFTATGISFLILIFIILRFIAIKRLKTLIHEVDTIAQSGAFNKRVSVSGNDEIGLLAERINSMIAKLEKAESSLKDSKKWLQRKIRSRTKKLEQVNRLLRQEILVHKELEKALKESEEKYKSLVENASQMIIIVQDEKIVYYNRDFIKTTEYDAKELIGKPFLLLVHSEDIEKVKNIHTNRRKGKKIEPYEIRFLKKNGEVRWGEVHAVEINWKNGPAILGFITDITEKRKLQIEKEKLQEQLIHAQKMEAVGRLAGGIAHDFNNLLTPIIGYTEILLAEFEKGNSPATEYLNEIKEVSLRASELVRQLLAFSRKQVLTVNRINLNDIISSTKKMLKRIIGEDIVLEINLEPEIKDIKADKSQMEQIILNIVVNARDAMPEGGKIIISTKNATISKKYCEKNIRAKPGEFVCFSIQDTGYGMDKETLDKIFEPFFTTKEPGKGTGLGLSVVYGIVEQHGGWINVDSKPNEGTTFYIYLPVFKEDLNNTATKRAHDRYEPQYFRGKGKHVLLVEDDEKVRNVTKKILIQNGYEVIDTQSAKNALDIFNEKKDKISFLITDIITTDITGIELVKKLQKEKPDLKILIISGYTDERLQFEYIQSHEIPFLQKPFTSKELLCIIETL